MQGGDRIGKKDISSILGVNKAGNSISEGFRVAQKLTEILTYLYFVGTFFFCFLFDLLSQCASFSKNFWTTFGLTIT